MQKINVFLSATNCALFVVLICLIINDRVHVVDIATVHRDLENTSVKWLEKNHPDMSKSLFSSFDHNVAQLRQEFDNMQNRLELMRVEDMRREFQTLYVVDHLHQDAQVFADSDSIEIKILEIDKSLDDLYSNRLNPCELELTNLENLLQPQNGSNDGSGDGENSFENQIGEKLKDLILAMSSSVLDQRNPPDLSKAKQLADELELVKYRLILLKLTYDKLNDERKEPFGRNALTLYKLPAWIGTIENTIQLMLPKLPFLERAPNQEQVKAELVRQDFQLFKQNGQTDSNSESSSAGLVGYKRSGDKLIFCVMHSSNYYAPAKIVLTKVQTVKLARELGTDPDSLFKDLKKFKFVEPLSNLANPNNFYAKPGLAIQFTKNDGSTKTVAVVAETRSDFNGSNWSSIEYNVDQSFFNSTVKFDDENKAYVTSKDDE